MQADCYVPLTEIAGTSISDEQLQRMINRYIWARHYCVGKRVLEAACGSGQGFQVLGAAAASMMAGDLSPAVLGFAAAAAGSRVPLVRFDAQLLPFAEASFDVIVIFEALYYVPDPERFFSEAARVVRSGGHLLVATANRDLYDFNPSPHSHVYFGADQLAERLAAHGFDAELFGDQPISDVSLRQRVLRPVKAIAVQSGLFPKTASGKEWLKRLVFGRLVEMPSVLEEGTRPFQPPAPISAVTPDRRHKVIFCAATRRNG